MSAGTESFNFKNRLLYWYPGHMVKSLRLMRSQLKAVDLVVEVRDARIPFSSINPRFEYLLAPGRTDRLIVYNKADLADQSSEQIVRDAFRRHANQDVMFTNSKDKKTVRRILQRAAEIAVKRENREKGVTAFIVGMPNVGKSSLINTLREIGTGKGKAAKVGPEAGVTRHIQERVRIFDDPAIYLVDTPGIMDPYIAEPRHALNVALTGGTKDRLIVEEFVGEYLLFLLNQRRSTEYMRFLDLSAGVVPPQSLEDLLPLLALRIGAVGRGGLPDLPRALSFWIRSYREGKWGRFILDPLDQMSIENYFSDPQTRHKEAEQRARERLKRGRLK